MTKGKNYKVDVLNLLRRTSSPVPVRRLLKMLGLTKTTRALRVALQELENNSIIARGGSRLDLIWLLHTE